jgi:hypothetical protein
MIKKPKVDSSSIHTTATFEFLVRSARKGKDVFTLRVYDADLTREASAVSDLITLLIEE